MIQTVTQNSALSQNWVECTGCTPKAQAARTAPRHRARRLVVLHWASYRGALGALSWRLSSVSWSCCSAHWLCSRAHARAVTPCRSSPVTIQKLYRGIESSCRVHYTSCRSAHWPCHRVHVAMSPSATFSYRSAAARCIMTQRVTPCHDTKIVS